MRVSKPQGHSSARRSPWGSPCEINHLFGGASCVEAAKEKVDGLLLCERHALEVKLEGQIACWGEMLLPHRSLVEGGKPPARGKMS